MKNRKKRRKGLGKVILGDLISETKALGRRAYKELAVSTGIFSPKGRKCRCRK